MNKDLKDKTLGELEQLVVELGQKKYLAGYIFHFIHVEGVAEISQITPLSKAFRTQLVEQGYHISRLAVLKKLTDKDGTVKYVFSVGNDDRMVRQAHHRLQKEPYPERSRRVETVLLPDQARRTLCVSTQVGCAMGCRFCATARIPLQRNLTADEIVDQVNVVQSDAGRISNVVYMGMGEPLANYAAVIRSLGILNHPKGKNIGIRHITVSTSGLAPAIKKLAGEEICPRLAVSLNAPTDALRSKLMPISAKYPIADLMAAVRFYQSRTRQRVTFEYVMIKDVNDSTEQAKMLVKLLEGLACNVNLIEHNPFPGCEFAGSDSTRIKQFASILERANVETTARFRMGRGIQAACGQLGASWLDGESRGGSQ